MLLKKNIFHKHIILILPFEILHLHRDIHHQSPLVEQFPWWEELLCL